MKQTVEELEKIYSDDDPFKLLGYSIFDGYNYDESVYSPFINSNDNDIKDKQLRVIKRRINIDPIDNFTIEVEYKYNKKGLIENIYIKQHKTVLEYIHFKYNTKNQIIEKSIYDGNRLFRKFELSYHNNDLKVIKEFCNGAIKDFHEYYIENDSLAQTFIYENNQLIQKILPGEEENQQWVYNFHKNGTLRSKELIKWVNDDLNIFTETQYFDEDNMIIKKEIKSYNFPHKEANVISQEETYYYKKGKIVQKNIITLYNDSNQYKKEIIMDYKNEQLFRMKTINFYTNQKNQYNEVFYSENGDIISEDSW